MSYNEYKDIILQELREGKNAKQINEKVPFTIKTVYKIINRLIEAGEITQIEIDMARNPDIKIVLEGLRKEKSAEEIKKDTTCSLSQIYKIIKKLIEAGIITKEETGVVRTKNDDEQNEKDKKTVLEELRKGKTAEEIEKSVTCSIRQVYRIINKLIETGEITQSEIDIARNPDIGIVLEGLRDGKSAKEIGKNVTCSLNQVHRIINKLIETGEITRSEIDMAKISRKEEEEQRILKLLKLGFTESEIRTIIDINKRLFELRMKGIINKRQLTEGEISRAYLNRERDAENRKKIIIERFQVKREVSLELIEEYIEYTTARAHLESLEYAEAELLGQVLVRDTSFITLSNANIVVTAYTRNNAHEKAIEFLDECVDAVGEEDSNKTAILRRAKQEIEANLERRKEASMNINESQPPQKQATFARPKEGLER